MFSTQQLVNKYEYYTDKELLELHNAISDYSEEAKQALAIVLERKGGLEKLLKQQKEKAIQETEEERITTEVLRLAKPGVDISFLQKMMTSSILSAEKLSEIVDKAYQAVIAEREDRKIKPRTIIGSLLGGILGSIIGGIIWGLQMVYSNKMFFIFLLGLGLLSYGLIRLFTKQSRNNVVVLVATGVSVIIAVFIGQLVYQLYGPQR